jgi:hypothetical protein
MVWVFLWFRRFVFPFFGKELVSWWFVMFDVDKRLFGGVLGGKSLSEGRGLVAEG